MWSRWNERVSLIGTGAVTLISDGRSTGIALGSASYSVPIRLARIEGGATGTILGTSDQGPSSSWLGFARAHLVGNDVGAWVGGGAGSVHHESATFGASTGELGVWARRGAQRLTLNGTAVRTSLISTTIFSDETIVRVRDPVGYTDVSLIGHGEWRRFELDALAMSRHTWKGNLASTPTASMTGTWWFAPYVAVAGAVGRQLADPMRGTARARYATVALRLSAERHGPVGTPKTPPRAGTGEASILATPAGDGVALVRVHAPGARRVEIMGDVTGWEARSLELRGGRWEVRLTMPSGAHHVVVRIDGGRWVPPANLPRMDDELGGTVGLIVIP